MVSLQLCPDLPATTHTGRGPALSAVPMIAIVDDDESVREATKALVRSMRYGAVTFASAEEFLESDHLDDMFCVITDVQMPGLSGVELQQRLIAEGQRLPVVFITAYPDERTRKLVLDAGAIGYLSKPFSDESLVQCLERALAAYNPGKAN
jgi:FixJ family two-component response regulator